MSVWPEVLDATGLRFGRVRERFSINKTGRVSEGNTSGLTGSASLRRTFPVQGEQDRGQHSKSLRPCTGRRVEKPGRLSSKASTEAAVSSRWRSAVDRSLSDLPFSGAGGRGLGCDGPQPNACQCVSLAFRSDGHSHQLGAFWLQSRKMSVAGITAPCDRRHEGKRLHSGKLSQSGVSNCLRSQTKCRFPASVASRGSGGACFPSQAYS